MDPPENKARHGRPAVPTRALALIALLQGLALLLLHQAIEVKTWPQASPPWLYSFYSMAFVGPVVLLLALERGRARVVCQWTGLFTLVVGLLGYYIGSQATPSPAVTPGPLLYTLVATLAIATFKALLYIQLYIQRAGRGDSRGYALLFRNSWRNFLTLALALLFALCVWGLLILWARLFEAIGIGLFYALFSQRWFYYPALALAHGLGIALFRHQSAIIDTIADILRALMKFLLVLLALVSILFLAALPFTGLAPLWESGGSTLILCLQALLLFAVNAVYQDDPGARPYPPWLHRGIWLSIALLPVFSGISYYGLSLRVSQYGWTVDRCWGFLLWGLLALFSLGYLGAILRRRDQWLHPLGRVNTTLGMVLLGAMLAVNSPLADFRKITVTSQLQRLERGAISPDEFDVEYFRYHLARPGYRALRRLKQRYADTRPGLVLRIESLYRSPGEPMVSPEGRSAFLDAIEVLSGEMPESLGRALYASTASNPGLVQGIHSYRLLPVDLDQNGDTDYLLIMQGQHFSLATLYYRENGAWQSVAMSIRDADPGVRDTALPADLDPDDVKLEKPRWLHLWIGEHKLAVEPGRAAPFAAPLPAPQDSPPR